MYEPSSPIFSGSTFWDNSANYGGALFGFLSVSPLLTDCTIVGNRANTGSAVMARDTTFFTLERCILAFMDGGVTTSCDNTGGIDLSLCDVYRNAGGDWVDCLATQAGMNGNISADPLFCHADTGNFHLDAASPCLDVGGRATIGAFGQGCDVATGVAGATPQGAVPVAPLCIEPNPFNPSATIRLQLARAGSVRLVVHDVIGRRVRLLVRDDLPAGGHEVVWNGRDDTGSVVAAGLYFARLVTADRVTSAKMMLLK